MKDKKIRILCAVTALVSVLTIIPVMFPFFEVNNSGITYREWGYQIYTLASINIAIGSLGLVALLWDLVYGAYALIDGRYRNLTWRIARYGYFYGIVMGLINLSFILSFMFWETPCACSIIFVVLIAATVVLKFFLIFSKDEQTKSTNV